MEAGEDADFPEWEALPDALPVAPQAAPPVDAGHDAGPEEAMIAAPDPNLDMAVDPLQDLLLVADSMEALAAAADSPLANQSAAAHPPQDWVTMQGAASSSMPAGLWKECDQCKQQSFFSQSRSRCDTCYEAVSFERRAIEQAREQGHPPIVLRRRVVVTDSLTLRGVPPPEGITDDTHAIVLRRMRPPNYHAVVTVRNWNADGDGLHLHRLRMSVASFDGAETSVYLQFVRLSDLDNLAAAPGTPATDPLILVLRHTDPVAIPNAPRGRKRDGDPDATGRRAPQRRRPGGAAAPGGPRADEAGAGQPLNGSGTGNGARACATLGSFDSRCVGLFVLVWLLATFGCWTSLQEAVLPCTELPLLLVLQALLSIGYISYLRGFHQAAQAVVERMSRHDFVLQSVCMYLVLSVTLGGPKPLLQQLLTPEVQTWMIQSPATAFLVSAVVSFLTGSSWAASGFMRAFSLSAPLQVRGSIISGICLGDFVSVVSDTSDAAVNAIPGSTTLGKLRHSMFFALPSTVLTLAIIFGLDNSTSISNPPPLVDLLPLAVLAVPVVVRLLFKVSALSSLIAGMCTTVIVVCVCSSMPLIDLVCIMVDGVSSQRIPCMLAFLAWMRIVLVPEAAMSHLISPVARVGDLGAVAAVAIVTILGCNNAVALEGLRPWLPTLFGVDSHTSSAGRSRVAAVIDLVGCATQMLVRSGIQLIFVLLPTDSYGQALLWMVFPLLLLVSLFASMFTSSSRIAHAQ